MARAGDSSSGLHFPSDPARVGRRPAGGSEPSEGEGGGRGSPRNRENPGTERPREEGLQEGGARCSTETEQRTAENQRRAAGDPSSYHTRAPRRRMEGPVSENVPELTPRSSSERKSGPSSRPSCGVGGAQRAGGGDEVGETQRDTH